ncbi:TM2 domain-containing protein [Nocardioides sp. JQ2195]|uniref:TM2 domain-containing protein n=1 Tax=Nocardioides sp. JQ2195 TaxID=2592334 RepID=UPI00143EB162|nr:TM2 domain-containing protein [Nocardioides sp. JQ2195]QIX26829.1 TM2 domain-containing protein [Nocardioides sp. JQ2195]
MSDFENQPSDDRPDHSHQPPPPPPHPGAGQPPPPPGAPQAQQPGWGQPGPGYANPHQPGYGAPVAYGSPDPAAPFGRHPMTGEPYGDKSKLIAGVLQLLVGAFGVGRFYTGHTGMAVAQLLTLGGCGIWSLIDGIMLLVTDSRDANGRLMKM